MEEANYRGTAYPGQCDHVGHMSIKWYVGKFDEANRNPFARLGLTPSYLRQFGTVRQCHPRDRGKASAG